MEIWLFPEHAAAELVDSLDEIPQNCFVWLEADHRELDKAMHLAEKLGHISIHEQHWQDCANLHHPSAFDTMYGYDLLIFRSLETNITDTAENNELQTQQVSFIVHRNLLLTFSNCRIMRTPKNKIRARNVQLLFTLDSLVYLILKNIIDDYLALRKPLSEQLKHWQNTLLDESKRFKNWLPLLVFKNKVQNLYMITEEQMDAVNEWHEDIEIEITDIIAVRIKDLQEHIQRVQRNAQKIEMELDALIQLHYSLLSSRTNEIMRILTAISGIFLPLNLITGIFGMNFARMPLLEATDGFYLTIFLMLLIPVSLITIFRWKDWL